MATIRIDDRVGRGPIRMRRPELYREILGPPKRAAGGAAEIGD